MPESESTSSQTFVSSILSSARGLRVLVAGEVILDRYLWGEVKRVSPEAPIPVLRVRRREDRPGNAAFVMSELRALGANVAALSVIGNDHNGQTLRTILETEGIDTDSLLVDPSRPTIVKERMMGYVQSDMRGTQQLLRVDEESTDPLSSTLEDLLFARIKAQAHPVNGILVSDINKGLLGPALIADMIALARTHRIPVIIDPKMDPDYLAYRHATVLTPNRHEAEMATGLKLSGKQDWALAADKLNQELDLEACLITLDRDGMYLAVNGGPHVHLPTTPRDVSDVSGAGDVVLSVFGLHVIAGYHFVEAASLANIAAGLEVGKLGAQVISRDELVRAVRVRHRSWATKIVPVDELELTLKNERLRGRKVVFANGCFDLLHAGHIDCLSFARAQGDLLVVGLNSDASVRAIKGTDRPIYPEADRARMLAALESVNYVVVFDDTSPEDLIKRLRPEVLVKGEEWRDKIVLGQEFVESYGGSVALAPIFKGRSTTRTIAKVSSPGDPQYFFEQAD